MATVESWNPYGVAFDITATGGTVTRTSATQYTVKISASWEVHYSGAKTNYGMTASSGGESVNLNSFGTYASSGSGSFTGTYSISGNSSATKTVTVTFKNYNTEDDISSTKDVSFSVTVPEWTYYNVTYDANGGSGAPTGTYKKYKDQTLTLSTTEPTRTGYTFLGWSTSSTATTATYSAGATLPASVNANTTLYAIWQEHVLTIYYRSNYATSAFDDAENEVGSDKNVTVLTSKRYYDNTYSGGLANYSTSSGTAYMTRTGYTAKGTWKTSDGFEVDEDTELATGQDYAEAFGLSLEDGDASVIVYAQWKQNILTVKYHSNYATYALIDEVENTDVNANEDIVVREKDYGYATTINYGLYNYSAEGDATYLARTRYDATGYWGTAPEVDVDTHEDAAGAIIDTENGIAIHEDDTSFTTGAELAEALDILSALESGDASIDLYAQWILLASRVTLYLPDENGDVVPKKGLVHIYDENGDLHYGILTVYTDEYDENGSNAHVVI